MERMITSATVGENSSLIVLQTPFHPGDVIEVTMKKLSEKKLQIKYPFHGKKIRYENPDQPVASGDWGILHYFQQ